MKVAIHQPGYLPWLGFFKKMSNVDLFVYLDDAEFVKNNFYNRNQIKLASGPTWLTVPILSSNNAKINEVKIDNTKNWSVKHKKSILLNYSKAEHYHELKDFFNQLYDNKFDTLIDLNIKIIEYIKNQLNINTKTVFSSDLGITSVGSKRVLDICKATNADYYISGIFWAKDNLKLDDFLDSGITVEFQEFQHPQYKQLYGGFVPNMSIIDLLFNEGSTVAQKILHDSTTSNSIFTKKE